ncbi:MAG: PilZ domain-containing protein [Myxococcaceae bacterium]
MGISMTQEMRRHTRRSLAVDFKGKDASGVGQLLLEGSDLSPGGTFIRSDLLLEQGEKLALEFQVPGVPRLMRAQARVAWVRRFPKEDEFPGMGVEFTTMSEEDRSVLTQYLATRE